MGDGAPIIFIFCQGHVKDPRQKWRETGIQDPRWIPAVVGLQVPAAGDDVTSEDQLSARYQHWRGVLMELKCQCTESFG